MTFFHIRRDGAELVDPHVAVRSTDGRGTHYDMGSTTSTFANARRRAILHALLTEADARGRPSITLAEMSAAFEEEAGEDLFVKQADGTWAGTIRGGTYTIEREVWEIG